MINQSENKMMTGVENKEVETSFFFPEHGVNVDAVSLEDAEKKVKKIISDKKINKDHE